jgi:hypothetical protein
LLKSSHTSDLLIIMNETLRTVFLVFFGSHIPITLCLDMQAVFGEYYPTPIRSFFLWYATSFLDGGDPLMDPNRGVGTKAWLESFIVCETLFQLPFFFFAVHYLYNRKEDDIKFTVWALVYGVHVASTVIPIEATLLLEYDISVQQRATLMAIYAPYLIIPAMLAWWAGTTLLALANNAQKKKKTKKMM